MNNDHGVLRVPVLVVGAGPAGLMTALLLARHGVDSLLVERRPGISILPRATGINVRTMEIFRVLGLEPAASYGLREDGAVLVRPDGHVAWRRRNASGDMAGDLSRALGTVLGRR